MTPWKIATERAAQIARTEAGRDGRTVAAMIRALPEPDEFRAAREADVEAMRARKNTAYEERNRVVAALARLFPSGLKRTDIPGWDAEWHGCVYIDTPAGQLSWHFHDNQAHLFDGLPPYSGEWDGHDTPEKYRRLAAVTRAAREADEEMLREAAKIIAVYQKRGIPIAEWTALKAQAPLFLAKLEERLK